MTARHRVHLLALAASLCLVAARAEEVFPGQGICVADNSETAITPCIDPAFVCNKAGAPECELDNDENMVSRWSCSAAHCARRYDPTGDFYACCKCRNGYYLNNPWASPLPAPAYCKPCWGRVAHCSRCDMYGPSYEGRMFKCTRCKPPYFLETTGKYAFRRCILPPIGPIG